MQHISGPAAAVVLTSPAFIVPPVPPAATGVAWLRASVGRFANGEVHQRRRALSIAVLEAIPPDSLRGGCHLHPVEVLAQAMGIGEPVVDVVRDIAQAYQPGTGDDARADQAVKQLIRLLAGRHDEMTAARIGVLVQACEPTAALIERARLRSVEEVLSEDPPVPATKRQARTPVTVGHVTVEADELVSVGLAGDLAFGTGPRRCPGRVHALAIVDGALDPAKW